MIYAYDVEILRLALANVERAAQDVAQHSEPNDYFRSGLCDVWYECHALRMTMDDLMKGNA